MIDFSTLKGLTIPEGVVKQIADASGRVLWSAAKKAIITLTGSLSTAGNYVEHNGIKYGSAGTFEAAIGDTITVHAGTVPSSATIYLNGTQVSSAISTTTYSYTVKCNTTINGANEGSGTSVTAKMYITEIPEGQILFTINGTNYFADEGMTWADWFASDYNTTGKTADDVQSISANGTAVELSAVIVDGTAYEVGFGPEIVTITLVQGPDSWTTGANGAFTYITHNGKTYTSPTTFEAAVGDTIEIVAGNNSMYGGEVKLNDNFVASGSPATYTYTVVSNATFEAIGYSMEGWVRITET